MAEDYLEDFKLSYGHLSLERSQVGRCLYALHLSVNLLTDLSYASDYGFHPLHSDSSQESLLLRLLEPMRLWELVHVFRN